MKDKDKSAEGEERDINPPLEMEWGESYTDENLFEDTDLRLGKTEAELHTALLAHRLAIPTTVAEVEFVEQMERIAAGPDALYRGVSEAGSIQYTGFNWHAATYLTDDLETAAIYGRFGKTQRASVPSGLNVLLADDPQVREMETAENPAAKARELGVQAIWNHTGSWVGKTHPHEFIMFDSSGVTYSPLSGEEQEKAERIKGYLTARFSRIAAVMEQSPDSCFVWVPVPPEVRDTIYSSSGLPPDQLEDPSLCHITVVHAKLGDADEDAVHEEVAATLGDLAHLFPQVTCTNGGLGYFDHEDQTVLWAPCSAPGLADMHTCIAMRMERLGVNVSRNHGFVPHMTVAYLPKGSRPDMSYPEQKWPIDEIAVTTANREERYPLGKVQQLAAARLLANLGAPYDPQALEVVCSAYSVPQSRIGAVQNQAIVLAKTAADPYENIHGFDPSSFDAPTEEGENMVQFAEDDLAEGLVEAKDGQGQIDVPQDDNTYLDVDETRTDRAIPRGPTTEVL